MLKNYKLEDIIPKELRKKLKEREREIKSKMPENLRSMNVFAEEGDKVICICVDKGFEEDQEIAKKYLRVGEVYTVKCTLPLDWATAVELVEFPGIIFNSVLFKDLEQ